ncbi:unnamed protein product [Ceratitis capitata]|uniref:(Mediterranean fruit fly) hypothetical protein n=1 Tax=Ceratitis capitata TaxID=7213 RepID=A0A811UW29_CERCA|nr:unnamed protein product [Ceratitis capitata]
MCFNQRGQGQSKSQIGRFENRYRKNNYNRYMSKVTESSDDEDNKTYLLEMLEAVTERELQQKQETSKSSRSKAAWMETPAPENLSEMQSFPGMVNYLGALVNKLSMKNKHLRDLLSKASVSTYLILIRTIPYQSMHQNMQ